MFSVLVPSLNSAYSPQCEPSAEISTSLITLVDLFTRGVAFSVLFSGVVIAIALIAWSCYSEAAAEEEGDRGGDSQESYAVSGLTYLVNDERIPNDVLVRWNESLCKSLIPESQTVYCPFRDCLALLVNDSGEVIEKIKYPSCHRSICARYRVPMHMEFSCNEFHRLNTKKRGNEDILVVELAKKKSWRKYPSCKTYVEKSDGCLHIICRCGNRVLPSVWVKVEQVFPWLPPNTMAVEAVQVNCSIE